MRLRLPIHVVLLALPPPARIWRPSRRASWPRSTPTAMSVTDAHQSKQVSYDARIMQCSEPWRPGGLRGLPRQQRVAAECCVARSQSKGGPDERSATIMVRDVQAGGLPVERGLCWIGPVGGTFHAVAPSERHRWLFLTAQGSAGRKGRRRSTRPAGETDPPPGAAFVRHRPGGHPGKADVKKATT